MLPEPVHEKTVDLFFCGKVEAGSEVPRRGVAELRTLQSEGYRIEVCDRRLPMSAFLQRTADAWLAWSPEGLGWDCMRHYEIAGCGTVQLVNYPSIHRHRPFLDGQHCILYGVEPGGLAGAVRRALADKPRLRQMGLAARAHVIENHTHRRMCSYIAQTCLAASNHSDTAASDAAPW
ncbi:MAG: glycosyltransferase family 1 protein [Gammaproteobacteria bacterium]|nr:glycosyltransferase family 1 protein [Gammaproteobacteria bacterium]